MKLKNGPKLERLKELFEYNSETGLFIRKISCGRQKAGVIAGTLMKDKKYVAIAIDGELYYAHRLAWLYMTGEWPKDLIDHIDIDGKNNKWVNLRETTNAQNLRNRKANKNNTTGVKGIHKNKDGYMVRICIGTYKTLEEATQIYNKAIAFYHGEFARAF